MQNPEDEIIVLVKYSEETGSDSAKIMNQNFIVQFESNQEMIDRNSDNGITGKFEQVHTPILYLNSVLLLGDAAHGF